MNTQCALSIRTISLAAVTLLSLHACDSLQEEGLPDPASPEISVNLDDLYVYANSTGVLDLSRGVMSNVPVIVSIAQQPEQGDLSLINPGIYAYTPLTGFTKGTDKISIKISTPTGTFSTMDTVEVHVEENSGQLPCNYYAVNEEVVLQSQDETVTIDVLANDIVCDPYVADPATLKIVYSTANGTSRVENGKIIYTHDPQKPLLDNIFYTVNLVNCPECIRGAYIRFSGSTSENCTGTALRPDQMTISTIGPVTFENEFTFARLKPMYNDIFCGDDATAVKVLSIVSGPVYGRAEVDRSESIKYWVPLNTMIDFRDTITYQVCVNGNCLTQNQFLTVRFDPTCGILASDDQITVNLPDAGSAFTLDVLTNDTVCHLADDVQIKIVEGPSSGEVWVENGKIYYSNSSTQFSEHIKYTICTSRGYCSPHTALVTVSK